MPTAHYAMGGIPTNVNAEVLRDNTTVVPGLYAAGECACVSVHGSNRLGTNSLLDINVFGKRAGNNAVEYVKTADFVPLPEDPAGVRARTASSSCATRPAPSASPCSARSCRTRWTERPGVPHRRVARPRSPRPSTSCASATRTSPSQDKGKRFNTDLLEASSSASCSTSPRSSSSRPATARRAAAATCATTTPKRDDENYMKHTMAYLTGDPHSADAADHITLDWKPVVITNYQPMERKY